MTSPKDNWSQAGGVVKETGLEVWVVDAQCHVWGEKRPLLAQTPKKNLPL